MTAEQFVYWLQGFCEVNGHSPTEDQWEVIKDHLQLVFKKETPTRPNTPPPYVPSTDPIPNDWGREWEIICSSLGHAPDIPTKVTCSQTASEE